MSEPAPHPDLPVDEPTLSRPTRGGRRPRRPAPTPPPPNRQSTRGRDGVTNDERDAPPNASADLTALESEHAARGPEQLALFTPGPHGRLTPALGGLGALEPTSSLPIARSWYRRELEQARRPKNTIESYSYDLQVLENMIGPKAINRVTRTDIARFLGEAETRSTRKRRLTSIRRFFGYLVSDARVLDRDPTDGFYPHAIPLQLPVPLFADEQESLLTAADVDEPWAAPAIHFMLKLGLTRAELLQLRLDHIDQTDPNHPVVYIVYEPGSRRGQERRLAGDAELAARLAIYLTAREPVDRLFPHGPPAVNFMVDRVRQAAGVTKAVSPQTLRHTFAVEKAKEGADVEQLLALLGLVDDPRNRASVDRYLKLAEPPLS